MALFGALTALALTVVVASGFAKSGVTITTRMALVTDIGGLNDKSFNQAANAGRLKVQTKLKVATRVYVTQAASDRIPNLQTAAQNYNIVFATGFFMGDPLDKVAPRFPNTKFAGIDVSIASIPSKAPNVRGIQFREQEAGYLAGYVAGLTVKQQGGPQVVSAIGANTVPPIVRYIGGYKAGAKRANAKVKVLVAYANDPTFSDQAKCKETALNQIQQRTKVIFQVAGGCGLGALSAAKEAGIWGIGVDVDQGYIGKHILTSALKDVSAAVYLTTAEFKRNPAAFRGGFDKVFNIKNGGIGYGKLSTRLKNRVAIAKKTDAIKKLIASGKIKPPAK
ncbi:MAG: BMP family ABC transporter substrate-binding protein [Actinomycetota bacterium]|nr:BMP family ABC transporter substrate-binding protein [Actinomycetota bacterium]